MVPVRRQGKSMGFLAVKPVVILSASTLGGIFSHHTSMGESKGPTQNDVTVVDDPPWEASSVWGVDGVRWEVGGGHGRTEGRGDWD